MYFVYLLFSICIIKSHDLTNDFYPFQETAEWLNNVIKDYLWPWLKLKIIEEYVEPAFETPVDIPGVGKIRYL